VGVVLGGEGADEFFFGYQAIQPKGHDYDLLKLLCTHDPAAENEVTKSFLRMFQNQYGDQAEQSLASFYFQIAGTLSPAQKSALLSPEFKKLTKDDLPIREYYESIMAGQSGMMGIGKLLQQMNLESLLGRLDSNTMLAGIEARVPYTDLHLIQLAANLPLNFKLAIKAGGTHELSSKLEERGLIESKRILRSIADLHQPASWNHRPKGSFPTPVFAWLENSWWPEVQQLLLGNRLLKEMFSAQHFHHILNSPTTLGPAIWALINLAIWDEIHANQESMLHVDLVESIIMS
jgi:asparagine synthase (glutamine-hydrolysing)